MRVENFDGRHTFQANVFEEAFAENDWELLGYIDHLQIGNARREFLDASIEPAKIYQNESDYINLSKHKGVYGCFFPSSKHIPIACGHHVAIHITIANAITRTFICISFD